MRFDRTDPAANAHRFRQVSWEATPFDGDAVVRTYGRKDSWKRVAITRSRRWRLPNRLIRATIKARLRHQYTIVAVPTP